ncbi:GTPase IMAP family member 7-like [Cyclopterus lumpus]|uniref:GTPase IMAP family member 7-like n=1 Tax=Cyclopterus lumpus TaxID=8103 RepID=UPI00148605FA|nr:GTPase IMAP family member 7-like [Cyclopterus lumpus]
MVRNGNVDAGDLITCPSCDLRRVYGKWRRFCLNLRWKVPLSETENLKAQQRPTRGKRHGARRLVETFDSLPDFTSKNINVLNSTRIAVLGKTGVGKSSVANTIFGGQGFTIGHTVNSETKKCQAVTKSVNGGNITLIDTPGVFDTDRSEEELKSDIVRCSTEFAPGPHAFLIVLKVERFTKHEQAAIIEIHQYFSEEVFKYATVLFTHGDQLPEGETIKEFIHDNKLVSDLVTKCGGRCHVIDNKYWKNNQQDEYRNNQVQVKELLKTIDKMVEENEGRCYTNEMLQAVEERIMQEMQLIKQTAGNKSEGEIREEAKENVFTWLWNKVSGFLSFVLLGAFFGLALMGKAVIKALKG